jgi:diacylglycerol O-acyltransferase / wax synthase
VAVVETLGSVDLGQHGLSLLDQLEVGSGALVFRHETRISRGLQMQALMLRARSQRRTLVGIMPPERLTPADALFLHLEDENTHMHVASCTIFEGSVDYTTALDEIGRRLHLVPRFRQKLAFVPFGQGRPVWIDDPHFNLAYHVRHTALPAPGSEDQLKNLAGRLMSQKLDRTKPLWEIWLVDKLAGNRFAMISKTHHCLVDGVSGADITAVLLDLEKDAIPIEPEPWEPEPEPSRAHLLADALKERATEPVEMARGFRSALRAPRRILKAGTEALEGAGALAWAGLNPAPKSCLNTNIGPHRRVEFVRASLSDFKLVKNAFGGTVNDVVLTVVTGALRTFLSERGVDCRGLELKAMVPVSTRADDERGALGNRVTSLAAPLPIYEEEPLLRLSIVRESMKDVKSSKQAVGAEMVMQLSGFAPPTILTQAARLQANQRLVNILVTNVPGPQFALWSQGHRLLDLFPMAPLSSNQALNVAVMSYDGQLGFGLLADYDSVPDLSVFAEGLEKSIAELVSAAESASARTEGNGSKADQQEGADGLEVADPAKTSGPRKT